MRSKKFCIDIVFSNLLLGLSVGFENLYVADFNINNIRGSVFFSQKQEGDPVLIYPNFQLPTLRVVRMLIFDLPVVWGKNVTDTCSLNRLGQLGWPLASTDNSFGNMSVENQQLVIVGHRYRLEPASPSRTHYPILGRTLVLYDTVSNDVIACSTILPYKQNMIYATSFLRDSPVAGVMHYLHGNNETSGPTLLWGTYYSVKGRRFVYVDHIVHAAIGKNLFATSDDCFQETSVYNPRGFNISDKDCLDGNQYECPIGDLKFKNPTPPIYAFPPPTRTRFSYVDALVPLHGKYSVLGRQQTLLANHIDPNTGNPIVLGCANVTLGGPRTYQALFASDKHAGIDGELVFSQQSPIHPTRIDIRLSGLRGRIGGYRVHDLAVTQVDDPCSVATVGKPLNPFGIVFDSSPPPGSGTPEFYQMGDLSGKFGHLLDRDNFSATFFDPSLSLWGKNSIMGRSIVLHGNGTNSNLLVCSNVLPTEGGTVVAVAKFSSADGPLQGFIAFRQYFLPTGAVSQTAITVDLSYSDPLIQPMAHRLEIHDNPVFMDEYVNIFERCQSTGDVYNPYSVAVDDTYQNQCSSEFPFRCQVGDLTGRAGVYTVGDEKKLIIDSVVTLLGHGSVVGRSVNLLATIHGKEEQYACSTIAPVEGPAIKRVHFAWKKSFAKNKNRTYLQLAISLRLSIATWQVAGLELSTSIATSCWRGSFYLIDIRSEPKVDELIRRFYWEFRNEAYEVAGGRQVLCETSKGNLKPNVLSILLGIPAILALSLIAPIG